MGARVNEIFKARREAKETFIMGAGPVRAGRVARVGEARFVSDDKTVFWHFVFTWAFFRCKAA